MLSSSGCSQLLRDEEDKFMLPDLISPMKYSIDQTMAFQPIREKMVHQIEYTYITSGGTPTPDGLTPSLIVEPPTGPFLMDLPEVELIKTAINYVQAIAAALPIDEEEDRKVRRFMNERMVNRRSRSLRK
jgi:hypothetical protein